MSICVQKRFSSISGIIGTFLLVLVKDSPYMQYFINMAGAEEELYKKWKEITLNSTGSDQVRIFFAQKLLQQN